MDALRTAVGVRLVRNGVEETITEMLKEMKERVVRGKTVRQLFRINLKPGAETENQLSLDLLLSSLREEQNHG